MTPLPFSIRILLGAFILGTTAPLVSLAQDAPPLQTDVRVAAKPTGLAASFKRKLSPGDATMSATVHNMPGDQTAFVALQFDYRIKADIALDQIISRIVILIEDTAGNEFSRCTIEPNEVHLNPNRVPLYYSATLYKPSPRTRYVVRVQVFGNYE